MEKILGANWRTSLSGWITVAAGVIYGKPDLLAFLPDAMEPVISGISGLIATISAAYFVWQAKDKSVTGGTTQQTSDGSVASRNSQERSSAVIETTQANPKT